MFQQFPTYLEWRKIHGTAVEKRERERERERDNTIFLKITKVFSKYIYIILNKDILI